MPVDQRQLIYDIQVYKGKQRDWKYNWKTKAVDKGDKYKLEDECILVVDFVLGTTVETNILLNCRSFGYSWLLTATVATASVIESL